MGEYSKHLGGIISDFRARSRAGRLMTLTMLFLFRFDDGATSASLAMDELDDPGIPHSSQSLECQNGQGASLRSMNSSVIVLYVMRWFSRRLVKT